MTVSLRESVQSIPFCKGLRVPQERGGPCEDSDPDLFSGKFGAQYCFLLLLCDIPWTQTVSGLMAAMFEIGLNCIC